METLSANDFRHDNLGRVRRSAIAMIWMAGAIVAHGQGTVGFSGQVAVHGTDYYEQGMWFRVVVPTQGPGNPSYDGMVIAPIPTPANIPYSTTPYMAFFQQFSPDDYVTLSLTNGSTFGLTSVQLADPNSPSLEPVAISFVGYLTGGFAVTNTFTTPGNGATTFQSYQFNPDFGSGLSRVDILAPRWAMDNLAFTVPEPSLVSLLLLGLVALRWWPAQKGVQKGVNP
jgi:hypothetical protein